MAPVEEEESFMREAQVKQRTVPIACHFSVTITSVSISFVAFSFTIYGIGE
jgi:hypothetical protein